jgi:hypothetical protein
MLNPQYVQNDNGDGLDWIRDEYEGSIIEDTGYSILIENPHTSGKIEIFDGYFELLDEDNGLIAKISGSFPHDDDDLAILLEQYANST